eukprot:11605873-Alexandrium_andersonii.AAC.1
MQYHQKRFIQGKMMEIWRGVWTRLGQSCRRAGPRGLVGRTTTRGSSTHMEGLHRAGLGPASRRTAS